MVVVVVVLVGVVVVVVGGVASQGTPLPSHVHVVLRQFRTTARLQVRKARPVSPAHAAAISSEQTLAPQGRVAVATDTNVLTASTAAANAPANFVVVIQNLLAHSAFCEGPWRGIGYLTSASFHSVHQGFAVHLQTRQPHRRQ